MFYLPPIRFSYLGSKKVRDRAFAAVRLVNNGKFTECRRVRRVIYAGDQNPEDLIFRMLVFKMFNRIETWELLEERLGGISVAAYDFDRYDAVLTNAMAAGARIYSAAYTIAFRWTEG